MPGLRDLIIAFGGLISQGIVLMAGLALVVFFWGLAVFIFRGDSEGNKEKGRNIMVWGIVALFIMVSVWGIIGIVQRDLGITELLVL